MNVKSEDKMNVMHLPQKLNKIYFIFIYTGDLFFYKEITHSIYMAYLTKGDQYRYLIFN